MWVPLREYPVRICQTHMLVTRIAIYEPYYGKSKKNKFRMDLLGKNPKNPIPNAPWDWNIYLHLP